jgi:phosphonate transport system ATP-binding protein
MAVAGLRVAPARTAGDPALQVTGLRASYADKPVLTGLSLEVRVGELVTLLGANGSGKSTALRCVAGLRPADGGTMVLAGQPLTSGHRRQVAMVFQAPQLVKRLSVLDNVCSGALGRLRFRECASRLLFPVSLREEALRCLDRVGLADRATERAGRLSGGQQQRVAIARALCQRAPLLLADEPVSALDPASAEQVLALLHDLAHTDGLAVLAVLHQPDLARRYSDRIIGLLQGEAVFDARPSKLTAKAIVALYAAPAPTGATG